MEEAGILRFARYDEVISAALAGQGVAPGGMPLLKQHLRDGRLVALFGKSLATPRGYYLIESASAGSGQAARDFVRWVKREAASAKLGGDMRPIPACPPLAVDEYSHAEQLTLA